MYSGYSYTTFDDLTLHLLQQIRPAKVLDIGYNDVRSQSALDLLKNPAETFEVIILGDVIEPTRKSEGQDLLEYLNYCAACLLVITPEAMPWHDLWAHTAMHGATPHAPGSAQPKNKPTLF